MAHQRRIGGWLATMALALARSSAAILANNGGES
jgi:hypothetical protein